ncbi:hypothetical protein, partial [Acinetobacter nosocomialis]|uniref:hypothetical protein n=1 Tax=Acinetobacter nosocomialis TaxID=106654 RepID=UPI0012501CD4
PDMPRPYKTPGGIVTSSIALILAVAAVVAGFVVNPKVWFIAAGYLSGGTAGAASAIANGANKGNGATLGLGNFDNSRKAYG